MFSPRAIGSTHGVQFDAFGSDRFNDAAYTTSAEPGYHFENPVIHAALMAYQAARRPLFGGEQLFVFVQKKTLNS